MELGFRGGYFLVAAWLQCLSLAHVSLSVLTALLVLGDILLLGRRQPMAIMAAVWPLTMLYFGPLGLVFYLWFGRAPARSPGGGHHHAAGPLWQAVFKGATHCGAGCVLGDLLGEWIAWTTRAELFGSAFAARLLLALGFAYGFGVLFQYFAIAPMRGLGLRQGLVAAVKADTLSLLAYELGMFAAMGLVAWLLPALTPAQGTYWLAMQGAMLAGFATTAPVNAWLIARGIKERM